MPRKSKIRWRESDAEKLTKEVERFNAKIYRTRSRHPEIADIQPETIKKEDKQKLIEKFKDMPRSEFNKYLNSLERYNRKGAEKEVVSKTGNRTTQWEKKEYGLKVAQINRERTHERKKRENVEVTSRGKPLGMKRGEMGSERMNELNKKNYDFDKIRGGKEWEKFKESIDKQSGYNAEYEKMKLYKMNYIKALEKAAGEYARETIDKLKQLPADKVIDIFFSEQEATIDFIYEPQVFRDKLDIIDDIWEEAYNESPDIVSYENWTEEDEKELQRWKEEMF